MYLDELESGPSLYIIMHVNWKYNDCWHERGGSSLTENIFEDYWEAQKICDLLNYKDLVENFYRILDRNQNLDVQKALVLERSPYFSFKEDGELSFTETEKPGQQELIGRTLQELGISTYEVLRIPKSKLK